MFAMMTWSCFLFFFYDALDILFFNKMKRERERHPFSAGSVHISLSIYLFGSMYIVAVACVWMYIAYSAILNRCM